MLDHWQTTATFYSFPNQGEDLNEEENKISMETMYSCNILKRKGNSRILSNDGRESWKVKEGFLACFRSGNASLCGELLHSVKSVAGVIESIIKNQ